MQIRKGDLFDTEQVCIGHGANCVGLMGAGIAKQFRDRYPNNYAKYRKHCLNNFAKLGDVFVQGERDKVIFNMFSQYYTGANASYEALFSSLLKSAELARDIGHKSMAIPMIGCGIGGLEDGKALAVIGAVEIVADFEFEVWKYEG